MREKRVVARVEMELRTEKEATTALRAIEPEKKIEASKVRVNLAANGKVLRLELEADDTASIRAALNSYLRWISVAKGV
ncbi:MAG: KEOPS complex subunit Pcc1, partial [Candidatus Hadarchaeales archaeon]